MSIFKTSSEYNVLFAVTISSLIMIISISSTHTDILQHVSAVNGPNNTITGNNLPTAQSVFDTGTMSMPSSSSVRGFLIYIPDEAHHLPSDDKTISPQNANYIPTHLTVPKKIAIAFVHGDPNHVHTELVKDNNTNQVVWQTTPVTIPGGSDTKGVCSGTYSISDSKYDPMRDL